MIDQSLPSLLMQGSMGVALAASAGLRAFLPLLVVGIAGRLDWIRLSAGFEWLSATPALVVFGIAVLVEVVADKFPLVDHALDLTEVVVKPVAGAVLAASMVTDWQPLHWTVAAVVAGGSIAGGVHVAKAKLRLASTALTAGFGNPVLSLCEDFSAAGASLAALFAPLIVAGVAIFALGVALTLLVWLNRRRRRSRAHAPASTPGTASLR